MKSEKLHANKFDIGKSYCVCEHIFRMQIKGILWKLKWIKNYN